MRKRNSAMILAVVFLLTVTLTACNGSKPDAGFKINVPKSASNEEKLAYNYIEVAAEIYQLGVGYSELGMPAFADNAFSMSGATVSAMRYAVDCLLDMKGSAPAEDGRLRDWDMIAALGWASPYPYFFEGVILEAGGDSAGAEECYRKAALNPNFIEGMDDFKTLAGLDEKALNGLKTTLEEIEDRIFEATNGPQFISIPRDENNFSVEFMREKGMALLEVGNENLQAALPYYQNAVRLNPKDGDNYVNLAIVYLYMDDGESMADCIRDGMDADPDNERLAFLTDKMKEVRGQ